MQNELFPHLHVVGKNWEEYLGRKGPPEEQGVPVSNQVHQPRVPVLGRKVPITSGCENHGGLRLKETESF